ncbi:PAS domain-containing protein [Roseiterribacter gracilis]|uniref:PAS domain-containing protein n=1 Tax=Roseiterribacter gracilis TaxID=2812848 RepID=A0A8S8XFV1_9PROT|nr:hypothetical protein TMPK1_30460 [Rhodospirillales bacterium TMPK1]
MTNNDNELQIEHPALRALYAFWRRARAVNGDVPSRAQIDVQDLAPWLASLLLVDVLPGPDFRYRVYGTELTLLFGKDRTGTLVRDFSVPAAELMPHDYEAALEARDAQRVARQRLVRLSARTRCTDMRTIETLILPLRRDGAAIEQLLVGAYALTPTAQILPWTRTATG